MAITDQSGCPSAILLEILLLSLFELRFDDSSMRLQLWMLVSGSVGRAVK